MDDTERIAAWRRARKYVIIGNLGEHVCGRLLIRLDYQLLGGQDDFAGFIPDVVGEPTQMNAEDFIAVSPDGRRLMTVNSKASASPRSCRITKAGHLSRPRLARGQASVEYSTERANLCSPIDGQSFLQVVKVDLVHMLAQIFEVDERGHLSPTEGPHDVADLVTAVLREFPEEIPPPRAWDL